jgi:hypothetical protein
MAARYQHEFARELNEDEASALWSPGIFRNERPDCPWVAFCWQPLALLLPRLTALGGLFYAPQIRTDIRKESVRAWKTLLGEEGFTLMLKSMTPACVDEILLIRRHYEMPAATDLLSPEPPAAVTLLRRYGSALAMACIVRWQPEAIVIRQLQLRLQLVLPPVLDDHVVRFARDETVKHCLALAHDIIACWHDKENSQ